MINEKGISPNAYKYKDAIMDVVVNSDLFKSYIKKQKIIKIFQGTLWAEGPCYIPHKDLLIWSDIPNNRVMQLYNGKIKEFRNPSNFCNGNTIDNEENIISCSHGGRCLYIANENLKITTLIDNYDGKKFNSPNDVCVKSDGTIWFTDPPYGILSDYEGYFGNQEYGGCYVFCYNPKINKLNVVTKNLNRPNGIAFSEDEKKLYIADSAEEIKSLYSFDVNNHQISNQKLIYDFKPFFADGFRCDIDGNIWTSAGKGIKCFNSNKDLLGQLLLPELVSNLEFGGKEGNILYVTATTSLYSIELNQIGAKFRK